VTFEEFQDNYDPCPTPEAYQNAKAAWEEATRQTANQCIDVIKHETPDLTAPHFAEFAWRFVHAIENEFGFIHQTTSSTPDPTSA